MTPSVAGASVALALCVMAGALQAPATPADPARARSRAASLLELARIESNLGNYRSSLESSREALSLYEAAGDELGIAWAVFRIGAAHDELGEYDDSQRHYHRALEVFRRHGDRKGESATLGALGTSYRFVGDARSALRFFEDSRDLVATTGPRRSLAMAVRSVAQAKEDLGRDEEAGRDYRRALALAEDESASWIEADLLFHLGRLARRSGRPEESSSLLRRGLERSARSENRWAEAHLRVELALLERDAENMGEALRLVEGGAAILREMGAPDLEWEARFHRAEILERAGRFGEAMDEHLRAVALLESVRSSIAVPILRSRFTPKIRRVYESVLRLMVREGGSAEDLASRTFEVADRQRGRTFAEMLAEFRIDPGAADSPLRRQERDLRAKIAALRARLTRFADEVADPPQLESELFEAERAHDACMLELWRRDPDSAAALAPHGVGIDAARACLRGDTDLVAFHLGEKASYGWLVRHDRTVLFELPPRREVENLVVFFRSLIVHRNDPASLRSVSRKLHDLLLGPIASSLAPGRSLVVVPDRALVLLPFEALIIEDPARGAARWLVEERAVSYAPSVAILARLVGRADAVRTGDGRDLLAFGDPALPEGSAEHRLVHAGTEIRRIASRVPARLHTVRTGADATETAFRAEAGRPARSIHLATHGVLDGAHPERSGLVFAEEPDGNADGFLGLAEVFGLRLASDLVVLSGCETARGEILEGEGVLGLSTAFLFAGARVVASSLWKVDDRSTERLMVSFYDNLGRGEPPDRALRRAKIDWIARAGPDTFDPFPWAGFVLIGDARRTVPLQTVSTRAWPWATGVMIVASVGLILWRLALAARREG